MPRFRRVVLALVIASCLFFQDARAKTIVIDTPDFCTRVEKATGDRIDLRRSSGVCNIDGPGKATVEVNDLIAQVNLYVDGLYWKSSSAVSPTLSINDVSRVTERAKKDGESLLITENRQSEEALQKARTTTQHAGSEEFQMRVEAERDRIYRDMHEDGIAGRRSEMNEDAVKPARLAPQERIYLFISSSVPLQTLRQYARAISNLGDPNIRMVMRGFVVGGKFVKPTVSFVRDVVFVDPNCDPRERRCATYRTEILIDPLLFKRYRIDKVPAFVYAPSLEMTDSDMSEGIGSSTRFSEHFAVYGDVSLQYALRLFQRERKSPGIEGLLTVLGE